jgi:hypothetical protein
LCGGRPRLLVGGGVAQPTAIVVSDAFLYFGEYTVQGVSRVAK